MAPLLTDLIARAHRREAVTYRETWPHEYVLSQRGAQQELLDAICHRFRAGEGVACRFFSMNNTYLFIGDHKCWLMTHWDNLEPGGNYVINRARLYRDRRDFLIQPGDTSSPRTTRTIRPTEPETDQEGTSMPQGRGSRPGTITTTGPRPATYAESVPLQGHRLRAG